jgi:hypothetical protein
MQKKIQFSGINRATPQSQSPDGACREIINMRKRKGCWRPVPNKAVKGSSVFYINEEPIVFERIFFHDIEQGVNQGEPNWIGIKDYSVYLVNPMMGIATLLIGNLNEDIEINIAFLKRFLLIGSGEGLLSYLWSEGSYTKIESLPVADVELLKDNLFLVDIPTMDRANLYPYDTGDKDHDGGVNAVLGNFYDVLNSQSNTEGRLYGSLMYITAYRLFDGSFIVPSTPKYFELSNDGIVIRQNQTGSGDYDCHFKFMVSGIKASINQDPYTNIVSATKDLVESVYIFATKVNPLHKIDKETLKPIWNNFPSDGHLKLDLFSTFFPSSDEFSKMIKSDGWYKIHEFKFDELTGKTGRKSESLDTKGYYQDYATRETLTTDQFSHHRIVAKSLYTYNDRLHASAVKTIYGSPYVLFPKFKDGYDMGSGSTPGKVTVYLKTSLGNAVVQSEIIIPTYKTATTVKVSKIDVASCESYITSFLANPAVGYVPNSIYYQKKTVPASFVPPVAKSNTDQTYGYNETANVTTYDVIYRTATTGITVLIPSIVGYNDSRAYRMIVSYTNGGTDCKLIDVPLKKHASLNFAYWHSEKFSSNELSLTDNYKEQVTQLSYLTSITLPSVIQTPFDPNRLQVSEIQNPLIYPAKNSYQIGTGEIIAVCSGSEPLSTGQFGQFPLQVFTTKGIWAMEIGLGDVLYTNILPVNGEVAQNAKNIVSVGSGVVYSNLRGLFVVSGRQVAQLSEIIEGLPVNIENKAEITTLLTDTKFTPSLNGSVSNVDFLDYLTGSSIGYDQVNSELVVSNPSKGYSYIFSFESKSWFKVSKSYSLLINNWPSLYGISGDSVYNLSEETTGLIDVLLITCAQSLESPDLFKKIDRSVLRSMVTSGANKYSGYYIFASDDLLTWQFLTGSQKTGTVKDFLCQRSHGSAKYYIFVFNGRVSVDMEIKEIDLVYMNRWNNKLR